jgi:hypothetical protein
MTAYEKAIQAAREKFDAAQRKADTVLARSPARDAAAEAQWRETVSRIRENVRAERAAALPLLLTPRTEPRRTEPRKRSGRTQ